MKRNFWRILLLVCVLLLTLTACIGRERAMEQKAMLDEFSTITYYFQDRLIGTETLVPGKPLANIPAGDCDWQDENGEPVDLTAYVVTEEDASFYIRTAASVATLQGNVRFREGHTRYIYARGNQFFPNEPVSRGDLAVMLCALLETDGVDPSVGYGFTDVPEGSEYAEAVTLVSAMGLMNGYADKTFRPENSVTRGEFAAVLNRLSGDAPEARTAEGYWAESILNWARGAGYLVGYDDGMDYPQRAVSRAEAVVMMNRIRDREPNRVAIDLVTEILPYVDVPREHWAFYDIIDACYSSELMAYILGEVPDAVPGFIIIDEELCHINPETLRLDYYVKGFHTIDDGLYYVPQNGYYIQRFEKGLEELDGDMFYVTEDDGPFLVDAEHGYLYFGLDGRYTSGSEAVDDHVDRILADILYDDSLSREEKLYEAYCSIRDGGYFYMSRPTGWQRGSTYWSLSCAKVMYETKGGVCYYWASAFLYLARRLGYQAYPVCGGVGTANQLHAWVMIEWDDGEEYIFDVELEWAYIRDFYNRGYTYINMFKQPRNSPSAIYVFPGESPSYYGVAEENNEDDVLDIPDDEQVPPEGGGSGEATDPENPDDPSATTPPENPDDPSATTPPENPDNPDDPTATTPPETPDMPDDPSATTPPDEPTDPPAVTDPPAATDPPVVPDPPAPTAPPVVPDPPAVPEVPVIPEPPAEELVPVE